MYTNNNNKAADVATGDSIDLGEEIEIQATQHSKIRVSLYHGLHCDITPDVESSWIARTAPIAIRDFTDVCGPTFHIDADSTPGSIFSHLFPDHLLETVVQQKNLYASQEMADGLHTFQRYCGGCGDDSVSGPFIPQTNEASEERHKSVVPCRQLQWICNQF